MAEETYSGFHAREAEVDESQLFYAEGLFDDTDVGCVEYICRAFDHSSTEELGSASSVDDEPIPVWGRSTVLSLPSRCAWEERLDEVIESVVQRAIRARDVVTCSGESAAGAPDLPESQSSQNSEQLSTKPASDGACSNAKKRGPTERQCKFCGVTLRHPSKIAAHLRTHTGERPYECEICHRTFTQRTPWRVHMKRHFGDTPFHCPRERCSKSFPNNASMKAHVLRFHDKRSRAGPPQPHLKPKKNQQETFEANNEKSCPRYVPTLQWDMPLDSMRTSCDSRLRSVEPAVKDVPDDASPPLNENTMRCRTYPAATVAKCSECGLLFKHPSKIKAHLRTHTGEKPFICDICGMALSTHSALRLHQRRQHSDDRPYECQWECGRRFVSISTRNEHERIVHAGIKRYQCTMETCRRLFTRRTYLVKHTRQVHRCFPPSLTSAQSNPLASDNERSGDSIVLSAEGHAPSQDATTAEIRLNYDWHG